MKWISVKDRLPEKGVPVLVFVPRKGDEEKYITIDLLDPDSDGDIWYWHNDNYERYVLAGPPGSIGPSEEAPYTHWQPLPEPPKGE